MDIKDVVEMLTIEITAEGALGTAAAVALIIAMIWGGGLLPILDALISKI